jgi:hypothetical protein
MGITDTNSYSHVIRDVFFNALSTDPFFASYTCRKNKMLVARPEYLPYLGVYIIDDTMTPDGDANVGNIRFIHALRIGFSVMQSDPDQDVLELGLDAAYHEIETRLWNDPYINNVYDTLNPHTQVQNPDNVRFESIERGMRRYVWGNQAVNNETPVGEMQYDITVRHRDYFVPGSFDDLNLIDMKTGVKPGDTQAEMDQRIQIERQYQFDNSSFQAKREFKQRRRGYGR